MVPDVQASRLDPAGIAGFDSDNRQFRRPHDRPHLRIGDYGLVRGGMGSTVDHRRNVSRIDRIGTSAVHDCQVRLPLAEGAGERSCRRFRVLAQAGPNGRGNRRHRTARHPGIHRQWRAHEGRGAGRTGKRAWSESAARSVLRRSSRPRWAGKAMGRKFGRLRRCRRPFKSRRAHDRGAAACIGASSQGRPTSRTLPSTQARSLGERVCRGTDRG